MGRVSRAKEKLLDSALDLIYARSYAGVGVQELCEHAGVRKGSFYHFYPSKRALTLAALDRQWEQVRHAVLEPSFASHLPPLKRLERCLDLFYELQCRVKSKTGKVLGCPFANLALELSTQDTVIGHKVVNIFEQFAGFLEQAVRDAIAANAIPKQDVETAAQSLLAYMEGVLLLAKTRDDAELIKKLRKGLISCLFSGSVTKRRKLRLSG